MAKATDGIHFLLNGEIKHIRGDISPTKSVLNYLRQDLGLVGSKEGCAEGDCGACTVVIGELVNDQLQLNAINACIQFVPTLDGKALFTIEYLRQKSALHPVQQAMVDHHGSQCGFCTPGFVMSLWSLYLEHQAQKTNPDNAQLRQALSGNLCRCTGYRPILDAGEDMMNYPKVSFDKNTIKANLQKIKRTKPLHLNSNEHFFAPQTVEQLLQLRAQKPKATLLAGSTDIGLWVNKQFKDLGDIIYLGEVSALKQLRQDEHKLYIGAGVSLNSAFAYIHEHYPEVHQQWQRFASTPIRNAGTIGGNIANGSPIGDSMPWLITLGTQIQLSKLHQQRTIALEDLYTDYMQNSMHSDEIIQTIIVPKPQANQIFRTYKLSKRYDSDISAVCAAFCFMLERNTIKQAKIAFGGVAATPKRAMNTEQFLLGKTWDTDCVTTAMNTLATDFTPLSDMRASAENRSASIKNLLYRFYLETRPEHALGQDQLSVF